MKLPATITARMTPEERAAFRACAEALGESPSSIVRSLCRQFVGMHGVPESPGVPRTVEQVVETSRRIAAKGTLYAADGVIDECERASLTTDTSQLMHGLWNHGEAA